MARRRALDSSNVMMAHDLSSGSKLPEQISSLLRSLGIALGEAYAECATPPATVKQLEAAKDALLGARAGLNGDIA